MRLGYRNPDKNFNIESNVGHVNFSIDDVHLAVSFNWSSEDLAPVERVNIFLSNGILLRNVFIVAGKLAYYYEKSWYYNEHIKADYPPAPSVNIFSRFNFTSNDVIAIVADNSPKPAKIDLWYKLALYKYNPLDSRKSIEKNVFVKEERWTKLPKPNDVDVIYHKELDFRAQGMERV